jgi:hypothetical protein
VLPLSTNHHIRDESGNMSDHLPILMDVSVVFSNQNVEEPYTSKPPTLKWDKCTDTKNISYSNRVSELLSTLAIPSPCLQCPDIHCTKKYCHTAIQTEYDNITRCLKKADHVLPCHKPGIQKDWWMVNLTELKNLWLKKGKPQNGPISAERLQI